MSFSSRPSILCNINYVICGIPRNITRCWRINAGSGGGFIQPCVGNSPDRTKGALVTDEESSSPPPRLRDPHPDRLQVRSLATRKRDAETLIEMRKNQKKKTRETKSGRKRRRGAKDILNARGAAAPTGDRVSSLISSHFLIVNSQLSRYFCRVVARTSPAHARAQRDIHINYNIRRHLFRSFVVSLGKLGVISYGTCDHLGCIIPPLPPPLPSLTVR